MHLVKSAEAASAEMNEIDDRMAEISDTLRRAADTPRA